MTKITSIKQIQERFRDDGDLRQGENLDLFEVEDHDDLGFYQQACEWLLMRIVALNSQIEKLRETHIDHFQHR